MGSSTSETPTPLSSPTTPLSPVRRSTKRGRSAMAADSAEEGSPRGTVRTRDQRSPDESFDEHEDLYMSVDQLKGIAKMFESTHSMAVPFLERFRSTIKTVSLDGAGTVYEFDADKLLWKKQSGDWLDLAISKFMTTYISEILELLYTSNSTDDETLVSKKAACAILTKELQNFRSNKTSTVAAVRRVVVAACQDSEFASLINRSQPHMLPIRGGRVIDLRDSTVRNRTVEDLFTFELTVDISTNAEQLQRAEIYLADIMINADKRAYLKVLCGYFLTAETADRGIYFFVGQGKNGKTFILRALRSILWRFYAEVKKDIVIDCGRNQAMGNSHTAHLQPLTEARVVSVDETDEDDKFAAGFVKKITGGSGLPIRGLYEKEQRTEGVTAKVVVPTNFTPIIDVTDKAVAARLRYLVFDTEFTDNPREGGEHPQRLEIPNLLNMVDSSHKRLFDSELLDAIFTIFADGARTYFQEYNGGNIPAPECVMKALKDFMKSQDEVEEFVNTSLDVFELNAPQRIFGEDLYLAYTDWRVRNDKAFDKKVPPNKFGKRVKQLVPNKRLTNRQTYFCALKTDV